MSGAEHDQSATVSVAPLHRRRRRAVSFVPEPPSPPAAPTRRPARVARMLALAHHLQEAIDRGLVKNRLDLSRRLEQTNPRITQLLSLLYLAPDIQEQVLKLEAVDGIEPITEKQLRALALCMDWTEQRKEWQSARHGCSVNSA